VSEHAGAALPIFLDFAIALFIGALVGIEREKKKATQDGAWGGLRTFILLAEAGAVAAWLSTRLGTHWIFVGTGLGVVAAILVAHVGQARTRPESVGLTTEVAALVVYLLGGAVLYGYREVGVALAITTSAILAYKRPLHRMVDRLGLEDILAGLKLLIATFIVLPVLPDHALDPWGALNPYHLWWLVILISGLSLLGYVAVRWLGTGRGTTLTGLFGGLVSSTAVTLSFARRSKDAATDVVLTSALSTGILLAWLVMFARILITVAVVERSLVTHLLVPLGTMGALTAAMAAVYAWRGSRSRQADPGEQDVALTNPFSLTAATKFGLFFAGIKLVVKLVEMYLPPSGLYAVAGLAGLTDVDAITLSMATSVHEGGDPRVATVAIIVAAVANTLAKCGMVLFLAAGVLRARIALATALVLSSGAAALWLS
jgi:uncharacterized membrane protein (DUF4010 family)